MNQEGFSTTEMDTHHPLIDKLLSLELSTDDYAVFGSGPMFAHGLIELGHDLDLVARGSAWEAASAKGEVKTTDSGNGNVIEFYEGEIEIFDSWAPGEWDIDILIDQAQMIGGIKFVELETVLAWKKMMNRPKDAAHIAFIEEYLRKNGK